MLRRFFVSPHGTNGARLDRSETRTRLRGFREFKIFLSEGEWVESGFGDQSVLGAVCRCVKKVAVWALCLAGVGGFPLKLIHSQEIQGV